MNGYSLICQCLIILASYQYSAAAPSAEVLEAARQREVNRIKEESLQGAAQVTGYSLSRYISPNSNADAGLLIHKIDRVINKFYLGSVDNNGNFNQEIDFGTYQMYDRKRIGSTVLFELGAAASQLYELTFSNENDAKTFNEYRG